MSQSHQAQSNNALSFSEHVALLAYSSAYYLIFPVLLLHWAVNRLRRKSDFNIKRLSRFAIYVEELTQCDVMIHCVSVGETAVAATLVKRLLAKQPNLTITLTTTTPTGARNVDNLLGDKVQHIYLPFDTGWFMSRLLNRLNPKRVLVVEVELWPNLIQQCMSRGISVSMINARMTSNSVKSYRKLGALVRPMMQSLEKVCAQSQRDYDNYLSLGLEKERLVNAGNIKFELNSSSQSNAHPLIELLKQSKRVKFIAGSTHDPEEKVLLDTLGLLRQDIPDILLILVPRHPQRFDKVAEILAQSKMTYTRSSDIQTLEDSISVLLIDEMGLLMSLYECADIAFVGGSIADRGGHNALEPASVGLPVMMGPNQYNNPEICNILREQGNLIDTENAQEIAQQSLLWLTDQDARLSAGQAGIRVIEQNSGALAKTIEFLRL